MTLTHVALLALFLTTESTTVKINNNLFLIIFAAGKDSIHLQHTMYCGQPLITLYNKKCEISDDIGRENFEKYC